MITDAGAQGPRPQLPLLRAQLSALFEGGQEILDVSSKRTHTVSLLPIMGELKDNVSGSCCRISWLTKSRGSAWVPLPGPAAPVSPAPASHPLPAGAEHWPRSLGSWTGPWMAGWGGCFSTGSPLPPFPCSRPAAPSSPGDSERQSLTESLRVGGRGARPPGALTPDATWELLLVSTSHSRRLHVPPGGSASHPRPRVEVT